MEQIRLKANPREILGKKVKILRGKGQIPAVLYGHNFKTIPLLLEKNEFEKIFSQAGSSTIVNLEIDSPKGGQAEKILIYEPQKDPVTDQILHVDLYKVDMSKEIHTEIPLKFTGVSKAVEDLEGNLITNKDALEVECLPDKLVSEIEVDITNLKTFDDIIKVNDLNIPEGIEVLDEAEEIVAQVTPPRSEEELEEMEQEATAEQEKAGIANMEAEAEKEKAQKATAEGEEVEAQPSTEAPPVKEEQPKQEPSKEK